MRDLAELIEIYRNKTIFNDVNLELAQSLNKGNVDKLQKKVMEEELIAMLLDILGDFLEYDSICMSYQVEFLIFKQIVPLQIPIENAESSVIAIVDINSQECIDVINLDGPLTKDEFEKFAKDYMKKL